MKLSAKHAYRNWRMRDVADKQYLRPDSAVREYVVLVLVLVALVFLGMHP
jgi:hypothetical protein